MMKTVIFARVSSVGDRQSTDRQVADLTKYATANGYDVTKTFTEHISGATLNKDRAVLNNCESYCIANGIETILCSEMSRLSRSVYELQDTIKWARDNHINIYFQKEGISIFDKEGKESMIFPILVSVIGFVSSVERTNISYRLNSGRTHAIEKGVRMGRPKGAKNKTDMKSKYKSAIELLNKGVSIEKVAKLTNHAKSTIQIIKKEYCRT